MRRQCRGLTLIELLIAVAIFAILATLAYGGLNTVLNTRDLAEQQAGRLAAVQRGFARLGRDFGQAVRRPIRDIHGDVQAAMQTSDERYADAELLVEFTVAGRRVLPGQQRSSLQRVAYAVREQSLLRLNWAVLDRAQDSEPYQAEILSGVDTPRLRYLDETGGWHDDWPPADADLQALPAAVELRFTDERWGELRRVFMVTG